MDAAGSRNGGPAGPAAGVLRAPRRLAAAAMVVLASGCASTGEAPHDPFEPVNRQIYEFNMALDRAVLEPVAQTYQDAVNPVFRYSIRSFFSNLEDVWTSANNLLQGKPAGALHDLARVALNSTFGFLGLADPATEMGFPKQREDFGQTLGVWGVPPGPYIVLPFFGPSNARDAVGFAVDMVADPLNEVVPEAGERVAATAVDIIDTRESLLGASKMLPGIALDEYTFLRDAYLQRRRNLIYDGDPPMDDDPPPDYDDEDDEDDEPPKR